MNIIFLQNIRINMDKNIYESDALVSQYCEFHYGDEYFGVKNFLQNAVEQLKPFVEDIKTHKALDLGCSVGRSSFELANIFDSVTAIDYSHNFINTAKNLQNENSIQYNVPVEGDINESKNIDLNRLHLSKNKSRVKFLQGDALNLDDSLQNFDLIFCSNLIDRLENPIIFLEEIKKRLNDNGLLVILSPYTWLEEYTPKNNWLGGYYKEDKKVLTLCKLKNELHPTLDLLDRFDVEFVIKETKRKFQHSISEMTVWGKPLES